MPHCPATSIIWGLLLAKINWRTEISACGTFTGTVVQVLQILPTMALARLAALRLCLPQLT
ncbi:hypothetical protein SAMN04488557_1732 [Hyphomicrobium facile]|uniref:Uncharacterized protein n=1 Tax=Hyphomicrobium facile TaxID=51670 RepID=A0A1I7NDP3_9HYPH|nr:hypothetical protein SAMN04488557_1732 [Hyphomicrobium facile]